MAEEGKGAAALVELRAKIDRIDEEIHRLLMERGSVIDALIHTKGTSRPGAAFRPGREADMMRRLVARHDGTLPLATVEHIWREIITTFTRMQAPFDVAIDVNVEPERMRDLARFYFGFSVNLEPLSGPAAVVAHVAETNDLGIVALRQPAEEGAWWRGLGGAARPRVMALLPVMDADRRPADLPALVLSPPLADPTPPDLAVVAVTGKAPKGATELAEADGDRLVVLPFGEVPQGATMLGGIARGIAIDGAGGLLYEKPAPQGKTRK
jgi:chorismate mutase